MAKGKKPQISKFGYGMLALYVAGIGLAAAGAYGITLKSLAMKMSESERIRAEMRTGRMVVTTDRVQCRTYRFDNVTAQVGTETTENCDERSAADVRGPATTFGTVSDSFNKR